MICLLCCNAYSQQFPNIQFNYLTEKEGLSNSNVSWITQDNEGFIWIGTEDGLNRFDGYRVRHFFHDPGNENSLVNNCIYRVMVDKADRLWITTREGMSVYEKKTGKFRNFRHNPADNTSLDNDQYMSVFTNTDNSAWVTTTSSLYYFDSSCSYKKAPAVDKPINAYQRLTPDRRGNLWADNREHIFLIDKRMMSTARTFGPFSGNVESIYQDSQFQYWIGSFGGGLMKFDPANGKVVNVRLASASMVIHCITEWWDQHHARWLVVASDHGLILVDPVSLESKEYNFHTGFVQHIPANNDVSHVYVDRQNILWVATEAGGVYYAEPSRQLFDLWNISNSGTPGTSVSDWIYSISEVTYGYWMSRWINPNLYYFNKEGVLKDSLTSITTASGKLFPLSDSLKPYYVCNDGDSILWFTTNEYLIHLDLNSKKALLYKPPDAEPFTGLRTITKVNDHCWWIRTRNNGPNGIYVFNPLSGKFTDHFTTGCNTCVARELLCIYLSHSKDIYLTAVGNGILKFDPHTGHFMTVFKFQGKDLLQHSNSFESLAEDQKGILWIASYTGLFALDPVSRKIVRDYTSDKLLGGVEISGIIFDDQQNAWLNTDRGIFYLLHTTGELRRLTITQGLTNNSNGSFQQGNDHSIYSGIQGYVLRINPSEILKRPNETPAVHFSEATVMDVSRLFGFNSDKKQLVIQPGQNRFSLDFAVMNYDGDNQYYYKLDGAMDNWQQNENGHLSFYSLSPGKYTLHVRGGNQFRDSPGSEDDVAIIVQPYWWQTTWFKLSCLVFAIAIATVLIRRRIIHIRHEASFKQKIAETEMMALRSQMNPHFIFNSLNSIENFMMQNEKRLASNYLNKFARLIRAILDSSRNELVPVVKDIEALRLYVDLEQLRFNHKFCFKLHVDPPLLSGDYKVPALLIQPYVENAIVHGLAHSERDDLSLTVSAILEEEYIHYRIEDNGIGRQQSSLYNQQKRAHHKSVGLTITEERINIFNSKHNANGRVVITDLYDENDVASGTRVDILIKAV
jgi:ligand-binding sensor domain-containing protein